MSILTKLKTLFEEQEIKLSLPPLLAFTDFGKPFRVETGGSSNTVAVILAQKKEDGKHRPFQYASKTINAANRSIQFAGKKH